MFDLEYKGANAVVLTTKQATVLFDPNLSIVGLKDIMHKGAVEITTEESFKVLNDDLRVLIEGPGEYEVADLSIRGIPASRHIDTNDKKAATIYRLEIGDIRIGVLGNIAPNLSDEQRESLGVVDVLVIPVGGGGYTLDATSASILVRHIDPKVVIPVHYADTALKYEVPQDVLETFVKELGAPVEVTSKYKVKAASMLPASLTVVEIKRTA